MSALSVDRGGGPGSNRRPGESQDPYSVTDHWGTLVVVLRQTRSWGNGSWLSPGRQRSAWHRYDHKSNHGIANRSVLPPLDMSTAPKPVAAKPRAPQSVCSLVSNLVSRVQSCLSPPQFSGLSFSLTTRLSASMASAKLKICFGWPLTSGCRQVLGSMRYQPRLVTALPSSVATAAITLCVVSLHQVRPVADGVCTASTMVLKKLGDDRMSDDNPRLFRKAANAPCVFGPSTPSIGAAS